MPFQIPPAVLEKLRSWRRQLELRRQAANADASRPEPMQGNFVDAIARLGADPAAALRLGDEIAANMGMWQDEVECQHDAFLLYGGLGPMSYLTSDGRVLEDQRAWDGDAVVEVHGFEAHQALIVGASLSGISELLDLIPPAPPGSATCPRCHGTRVVAHPVIPEGVACTHCAARGWIDVPESGPDAALPAPER